ncbi:MAG: glycosyltransferase family 4 protein [bacterium]
MHILMVCNSYTTDNMGGSERYIENVSKEMVKLKHKVTILTGRYDSKKPLYERNNGIEIIKYNVFNANFLSCWISIFLGVKKKLPTIKNIDLIVLHHPQSALGAIISNKNIKKVYHFYSCWHKEWISLLSCKKSKIIKYTFFIWLKILPQIMKYLQKYCLNKSNKIICLSEFSFKELTEIFQCPKEKIEIIPGGVDIEKFKPPIDKTIIKQKLQLPKNKKILLTVRRLVPRMGIENLIKAMSLITKECPNTFLVIVGKGNSLSYYQKIVENLKLTNQIKFTGFIKDEYLHLYYQIADLFIIPTQELEGFGLVILEALSCGVPVIGTNIGAIPEILKKIDEKLIVKNSLSETIINFLKQEKKMSFDLRNFVVNNYSWTQIAKKIEKEYLVLK